MDFNSRRSVVTCTEGCAASSNPLASQIGVDVLNRGGNAADAAVAMAAALNLMEPCSTGIGGDAFCLFFDAKSKQVKSMNASGRSPRQLDLETVKKFGFDADNKFPPTHVLSVTVPGACAGWVDCVERFGSRKLTLAQLLDPAISYARRGFPVSGPVTAHAWGEGGGKLRGPGAGDLLVRRDVKEDDDDVEWRAPKWGEVFTNHALASVFQEVATNGRKGFYEGWIGERIVDAVREEGGVMTQQDLNEHRSTFEDPICVEYKGYKLWETQPNSQGIVALLALSILKNFDLSKYEHNSQQYLHLLIEAFRLAFEDGAKYCGDQQCGNEVPVAHLISDEYGRARSALIRKDGTAMKGGEECVPGEPFRMDGDTVYFTTADRHGNACSFINSNYMGFGTGIVPRGTGFSLQNRGANFNLSPGHVNCLSGGKRPYHTIIPAMLTDARTDELVLSFGVMGGFMQPQGHVQVLFNMVHFGMDPQEALDAPRFLLGTGHRSASGGVNLERGIGADVAEALRARGHELAAVDVAGFERSLFGRGQVIATRRLWAGERFRSKGGVYWAGSDPRADGCAIGY